MIKYGGGLLRPQRYSKDAGEFERIKAKSRETIAECVEYIEERLNGVYKVELRLLIRFCTYFGVGACVTVSGWRRGILST